MNKLCTKKQKHDIEFERTVDLDEDFVSIIF